MISNWSAPGDGQKASSMGDDLDDLLDEIEGKFQETSQHHQNATSSKGQSSK